MLRTIRVRKNRYFSRATSFNPSIHYFLKRKHIKYETPFLSNEIHHIVYNDTMQIRDTIPNRDFSLVKEVYQGKLEDLRYYIEFKPHVGW